MKYARGFTLFEAVIYLTLFSILIGGGVIAAFNLFQSAAYGGTYMALSEESDFMLAKMRWALAQADSIASPPLATFDTALTVHEHDGTDVEFERNGTDLVMRTNGGTWKALNASGVIVEDIRFEHLAAYESNPESLVIVLALSTRTGNGMKLTHIATTTVYVEP